MSDEKIRRLETEVERLKSAVQELTVLNDLAITATSSLEVDQMLDIIVEKSIQAVRAEQGSILLLTEDQKTPLKTLIRQEDRSKPGAAYKIGANITGWVLKHQQPLKIDNLATDSRFHTSESERRVIHSVLCMPIRFRTELLGVLTVANKKIGEAFTESDLRLLGILAAQSGQLIRNSQLQAQTLENRRLAHELQLARNIQRRLLPDRTPTNKHLEVASFFNAADEVSGDYYDYFDLGEDRVGIVLADVSGHGVSAALMMTMARGVIHAIAQIFASADQVLTEANSILKRTMPQDMFVTMVFLVFDTTQNTLHFSNAGHHPLLHYSQKQKICSPIDLRGPALGLMTNPKYSNRSVPYETGDFFLVFTDGLSEAFNARGEMFGDERLLRACLSAAGHSAQQIINHIRDDLQAFIGEARQSDDIAIIAVKAKK